MGFLDSAAVYMLDVFFFWWIKFDMTECTCNMWSFVFDGCRPLTVGIKESPHIQKNDLSHLGKANTETQSSLGLKESLYTVNETMFPNVYDLTSHEDIWGTNSFSCCKCNDHFISISKPWRTWLYPCYWSLIDWIWLQGYISLIISLGISWRSDGFCPWKVHGEVRIPL